MLTRSLLPRLARAVLALGLFCASPLASQGVPQPAEAPPTAGAGAYRTMLGGAVFAPIGGAARPDSLLAVAVPNFRASLQWQVGRTFGMHVGGLFFTQTAEVTQEEISQNNVLMGGVAGFRLNFLRGRLRMAPFVDVGGGLMHIAVDSGGYGYQAQGGAGYQPRWVRAQTPVAGGGGGLTFEAILGPGLTFELTGGQWHFRPLESQEFKPFDARFVGAGFRFAIRDERWYWRTSGADREGPRLVVLATNDDGELDFGTSTGVVRLVVQDRSGVGSVQVGGTVVELTPLPELMRQQLGIEGPAMYGEAQISLHDGPNRLEAIAYDGAGNRGVQPLVVHGVPLDTASPMIAVLSPNDPLQRDRVEMSGVISDQSPLTRVEVNGIAAQLRPATAEERERAGFGEGANAYRFNVEVPLEVGENLMQVVAVDTARNEGLIEHRIVRRSALAQGAGQASSSGGPIIEITEPREWAGVSTRGIGVAPRRSITVRGQVRHTAAISEVRIDGARAAFNAQGTGMQGSFLGYVPVTPETRQVRIEVVGSDGRVTTQTYQVSPTLAGDAPAGAPAAPYAGAGGETFRGKRWAVIVGISDYRDPNIPDLNYADRDAQAMYDFFRSAEAGLGGIPEENMRLLLNGDATQRNIRSAMFTFLQQSTPDDVIYIYIAGHGMPDPQRLHNLYILAHDTELADLPATGVPMADVNQAISTAYARNKVLITDACHSAGVGAQGTRNVNINSINAAFLDHINSSTGGFVAFTASESTQLSNEGPQWGGGHGVFTYYLLEGMRGAADEDGDGVVTLGELMEFVRDRVRRETRNAQIPTMSQTTFDRYWPMSIVLSAAQEAPVAGEAGR